MTSHRPQAVWAFLVAQVVKNLPEMQETLVQSLGREDPLEKAMAIHSSTLAWKIPWMEELDMTERLHFHFSLSQPRVL